MNTLLTGVKPTGTFHLGNYLNTIAPILKSDKKPICLIADYHALTTHDKKVTEYTYDLIATFLSFGIENIIIQSNYSEILELNWILSCFTAKGLLNRAHVYKDMVENNLKRNKEADDGVNMGIFNYPVLMTADLLMFDTDYVSVGKDQAQHIEIARDIANKLNHRYKKNYFRIPEPVINDVTIPGYDSRKMSKSYENVIPLFCSEKKLRKHIFSMKTNAKREGQFKAMQESPVCEVFKAFSSEEDVEELREEMRKGLSWKDVKERTFQNVNFSIAQARETYQMIRRDRSYLMSRIHGFEVQMLEVAERRMGEIKDIIFSG